MTLKGWKQLILAENRKKTSFRPIMTSYVKNETSGDKKFFQNIQLIKGTTFSIKTPFIGSKVQKLKKILNKY